MNNNYDQYLLNEISIVVVFLCILVILAVIIASFGIKYFKNRQTKNAIACSIFFSVIIIACIVSVVYCIPYISDIKNHSYIRYEGVFYVTDGEYDLRSGSQPLVKFESFEDRERFKLRGDTYLSDGCHEGYIIYSQRSKMIVEWHCNNCAQK